MSSPTHKPTTFVAEYKTPYAAITEPNKLVFCTHYFVRRWMPLLGGSGTMIVLSLRQKCYHDRENGDHREETKMTLVELAARCGISVATLKRELASNEVLQVFVQRERNYRTDELTGRNYRDENTYHVLMEDPMHVDDVKRYNEKQANQEKGKPRKVQSEPYSFKGKGRKISKAQSEPQAVQNDSVGIQEEGQAAQNAGARVQDAPTLSDTLVTENIKDTLDERASEAQKIEQGETEKNGLAPVSASPPAIVVKKTLADLADAERLRILQAAEKECAAYFGPNWVGHRHRNRLLEQRAEGILAEEQRLMALNGGAEC